MTRPVAAGDAEADAPGADRPTPAFAPDGVRLKRLRAGQSDEQLFLLPGLEGVLDEVGPVAAACTGPQEVHAVAPLLRDAQGRPVSDVERMAQLVLAAIRHVQPAGPYRLGGYSFGGLVALEAARQLRAGGEDVEALFLIDAVYDERYWPRGIWLRALLRRTTWQLSRIVRMPPARAVGELRRRGVRLARRVVRRTTGAPDSSRVEADQTSALARAQAALGAYRPGHYDGTITLIAPSVDRHFGCDTVRLWAGYATRIEVQRVDGDHLSMVQEPASVAAVARIIDHRLATRRVGWAGLLPVPGFERPMILTTMRWFSAARLAQALTEAGFAVSACRPAGHPLGLVGGLTSDHRLHRMWQLSSLAKAIHATRPDVILPDDERALVLLRRLYARMRSADAQTAAVIARSLGEVDRWSLITSRAALANEARRVGVAAPESDVVDDADALRRWAAGRSMPIVLKTDGSWGGRGVAIVSEAERLRAAWRAISNPPGLPRATKRLLVNREAGPLAAWARRRHPVVNAQEFVEGREAIVTAACVHGEVKALVCLEVIEASEARGPASVVRIIDHAGLADNARRLATRLGLHGFCGFDFIINDCGDARLLELNPRITPTAHLLIENCYRPGQIIVLFPPGLAGAIRVDAAEPPAAGAWALDVPVRAPLLVECGERSVLRQNRPVTRMARRLRRELSARLDGQHVR
jgi:thioesterase domain-containing protein